MAKIQLHTLPTEQHSTYAGCWCEFGAEGVLGIYECASLGGRIKVPGEATPVYRDPSQITILTDLQRAWSADGLPMPRRW